MGEGEVDILEELIQALRGGVTGDLNVGIWRTACLEGLIWV